MSDPLYKFRWDFLTSLFKLDPSFRFKTRNYYTEHSAFQVALEAHRELHPTVEELCRDYDPVFSVNPNLDLLLREGSESFRLCTTSCSAMSSTMQFYLPDTYAKEVAELDPDSPAPKVAETFLAEYRKAFEQQ